MKEFLKDTASSALGAGIAIVGCSAVIGVVATIGSRAFLKHAMETGVFDKIQEEIKTES